MATLRIEQALKKKGKNRFSDFSFRRPGNERRSDAGSSVILCQFRFDWIKVANRQWSNLNPKDPVDAGILFFFSVYRLLVAGLATRSNNVFQKCLQRFFDKMRDLNSWIFLLNLVWNYAESSGYAVNTVSLKIAAVHIREKSRSTWLGCWIQKLCGPSASGRIGKFEFSCPSNSTWRDSDAGHFNDNSSSAPELSSINWNWEPE